MITETTEREQLDDPLSSYGREMRTRRDLPPDRVGRVLRRWWLIALVGLAAAGGAYALSSVMPSRYEASADVSVTLLGNGLSQQSVSASNDLASQYAQVIDAAPVVDAAAARLGVPPASLRGDVDGGTLADQNIVQVRAHAPTAAQAVDRAQAVSAAFIRYVERAGRRRSAAYTRAAAQQLRPLDDQIRETQRQLASTPIDSAAAQATEQTLSALVAQRASAFARVASEAANARADLTILNPPAMASKVAPRPVLYSVVALLVGLFVAAQLAALWPLRRERRR
jgi:capsular polysaccharide biosynthesis protein